MTALNYIACSAVLLIVVVFAVLLGAPVPPGAF